MSEIVAVYADGGVIRQNPSPIGGTWAACHVDGDGARIWEGSGVLEPLDTGSALVTNNQTEFWALLMAISDLPHGWSGQVCSDSQVTLGRFFRGWPLRNIAPSWQSLMATAIRKLGIVQPVLLAGHPSRAQLSAGRGRHGFSVSEHNVFCDRRCGEEARAYLGKVGSQAVGVMARHAEATS